MHLVSKFAVRTRILAAAISLSIVVIGFLHPSLQVFVSRSRPAECPMHQSAPPPSPTDHRCCQSGHIAMLQKAVVPAHDAIVSLDHNLEHRAASADNSADLWADTASPGTPPCN